MWGHVKGGSPSDTPLETLVAKAPQAGHESLSCVAKIVLRQNEIEVPVSFELLNVNSGWTSGEVKWP